MTVCPYCGAQAEDTDAEIAHMEAAHADIIRQRKLDAGFAWDEHTGRWVDTLTDD